MCYRFVKCRKCINISSPFNFCALPFQMWDVPHGGHSLNQTDGDCLVCSRGGNFPTCFRSRVEVLCLPAV